MSDIYLKQTLDGPAFVISAGDPQVTDGIDNAVYLSLFSGPCWMNDGAEESEKFISKIPEIMATQLLNNQTRLDMIEAAKEALQWLVTDKIADKIEVRAEIPALGTLYLAVTVYEPQKTEGTVFKYSANWDAQKLIVQEATW